MKKTVTLAIALAIMSGIYAQHFDWTTSGGGNTGSLVPKAIVTDDAGYSYVTGYFSGTVDIGGFSLNSMGMNDAYIAKYDSDGVVVWAVKQGGSLDDFGDAICLDDAGGVYACGNFASSNAVFGTDMLASIGGKDAYLTRYTTDGVYDWAVRGGGLMDDVFQGITYDELSGKLFATGYFISSFVMDGHSLGGWGNTDVLFASLFADGSVNWLKQAGGFSWDSGIDIDAENGFVYITGEFIQSADFDTIHVSTSNFQDDYFTAKYDTSGSALWVRYSDGPGFANGWDVHAAPDGTVYVCGFYEGTQDFHGSVPVTYGSRDAFWLRYDANGVMEYIGFGGSAGLDYATGIHAGSDGNFYVTGFLDGPGDIGSFTGLVPHGMRDAWVTKVTYYGMQPWLELYGGAGTDAGQAISMDASDNLYVAAYGTGMIYTNSDTLSLSNTENGLLSRVAPCDVPDQNVTVTDGEACLGEDGLITIHAAEAGVPYTVYLDGAILGTFTGGGLDLPITIPSSMATVGEHIITIEALGSDCPVAVAILDTAYLWVHELPEPIIIYVYSGSDGVVVFENIGTSAWEIITWYFGDGNSSNDPMPTYQYTSGGTYEVCLVLFDTEGCTDSVCETLTIAVGLPDLSDIGLFINPMPVTNTLFISGNTDLGESGQILLYDALGRQLYEHSFVNVIPSFTDVSWLNPGMYVLELKTSEGSWTARIFKQ